jgi:chromosomal replication initiation ATPase DnaA
MGVDAEDTDTNHMTELNGEVLELVKKNGWKKAIIKLRSLNSNKEKVQEIDTYEHIIQTVVQVYGISEKQLYEETSKFVATDARRTAYVLINKYLNYTQTNIGTQFGKTRVAVNWAMLEFNKMIKDEGGFYIDFQKKHKEAETVVLERLRKEAEAIEKLEKASKAKEKKVK